ncbi:MAG: NAD(P)H-hydrate dehydratase, partial [Candidatus Marsarchaeota archaeon]|nr:NAD(P)H-hydrate dehydratase [Candidatus Marsarchaeota archaeon]
GAGYGSLASYPELIVKELPGEAREVATAIAGIKHNVIVVGPGIERSEVEFGLTNEVVREEASKKNIMVIDAGAMDVVKEYKNMLNRRMILTPHEGEFRELTGIKLAGKNIREKIHAAINFAKGSNCTIVLKGHTTIITNGERLKINIAKSAALATMGTGDVLDGIIGSFAAATGKAFESAVAGVYIHSLAGDRLAESVGNGATARDLIDEIPKVIKEFRTL